jgi:hypothetical protein
MSPEHAVIETSSVAMIESPMPAVYSVLATHQREEKWQLREVIAYFQNWANRFNIEFKLDVPEVVLSIDRLPVTRYGQFRCGHNGLGLRGEITLNSKYVSTREPWEVLGTLLHELVHAWQQTHGKMSARKHHNAEFRQKAQELGLVVNGRGVTGYTAESAFKSLLRTHGVDVPAGEVSPPRERKPGASKLVKWTCACRTNVRVAVADFRALCLKCNTEFVQSNLTRDITLVAMLPREDGKGMEVVTKVISVWDQA